MSIAVQKWNVGQGAAARTLGAHLSWILWQTVKSWPGEPVESGELVTPSWVFASVLTFPILDPKVHHAIGFWGFRSILGPHLLEI